MFKNVELQLYSVRNHMEDLEGIRYTFKRLAEIDYTEIQAAGDFPCMEKEFMDAAKSICLKVIGTHYELRL